VANVASDDDAEAAAEAALSTVDSDFGRTTDPVRMYMREMGSVELLTREGEIEIAKRIEDGLKDMIQAISACPTTIAEILAALTASPRTRSRSTKSSTAWSTRTRANSRSTAASDSTRTTRKRKKEDEEEEETRAAARCRRLLRRTAGTVEARRAGQVRRHRTQFDKMRKAFEKEGYNPSPTSRRRNHLNELLGIRFTAKIVEKLCDTLRGRWTKCVP
jgi:RNA polymerase primary sigma factor